MSGDTIQRWTDLGAGKLVGRTIIGFRYLTDEEKGHMGWDASAPVLILDDGTAIWPSADDEGNDAGALFTTLDDVPIVPVIRSW